MKMNIIESMLIGLGIGGFITSIYWAFNGQPLVVGVALVQSLLQGLAVFLIYYLLPLPFLVRFVIHALSSYLLASMVYFTVIYVKGSMTALSFVYFTLTWLFIYIVLFIYFHIKNTREAREINDNLRKQAKNENHKS